MHEITRELQSVSLRVEIRFVLGPIEFQSSSLTPPSYRVKCHAYATSDPTVYVAEWAGNGLSWLLMKADELPFGLAWPFDGMPKEMLPGIESK